MLGRGLPGVADAAGPELADLADAVPTAQRGGFALLRKTDAAPERIEALVALLRAENPPQFAIASMTYAPEQAATTWDAVWAALAPRLSEVPDGERTQVEAIGAQCMAAVNAAPKLKQRQDAYVQGLQALERVPAVIRVAWPVFLANKHVGKVETFLSAPLEAANIDFGAVMPEFAAMAPAPPPPPPQDVSFFTDVRFPDRVKRGEVQWLTVQLTLEAIEESMVTATVPVRFEASSPNELPPPEFVEVRLVADEDEVPLAWEHVDDMFDDRLAFEADQRLGDRIAGAAKALAEAGHRDDDLHVALDARRAEGLILRRWPVIVTFLCRLADRVMGGMKFDRSPPRHRR